MIENEPVHVVHDASPPRRDFLRTSLLLAVPLVLGGTALPAAAAYDPPGRTRGGTRISVRSKGAVGNGIKDDTAAFQKAIDALPSAGGTVYVAAGTYLIDALRSVQLRSRMHLEMAPGAKLVAQPNSADGSEVLYADDVQDVEISGGQIVGERDQHRGTSGEWGMGIRIRGSERVTIRDIRISKCWGDGITVGPKPVWRAPYIVSRDVVISNVVSTGNRRQGLSIGNAIGVKVYDSEFSDSNGTSPQCGIDVEPTPGPDGKGYADNVHIENCLVRGNASYGFMLYKQARNVTVTKCIIENNKSCGLVSHGSIGAVITSNTVRNNVSTGVFIQKETKDCQVSENTFSKNFTKQGIQVRAPFSQTGASGVRKDVLVSGTGLSNIRIGRNHYR